MDFSPFIAMGVSAVGSMTTGFFLKHSTPISNKAIPVTNPLMWSGGTAAVTQDPMDVGGSFVGSLLAWGVHRVHRRVKTGAWRSE